MIRSAHIDTFARDHLPSPEQWPEFLFDLADVRYPERVNCVTAFLDDWLTAGHGGRDCLISPTERLSYAALAERVNRIANALTRDLGIVPDCLVVGRDAAVVVALGVVREAPVPVGPGDATAAPAA